MRGLSFRAASIRRASQLRLRVRKYVGARVRAARKAAGMGQYDVCQMLGIYQSTLSHFELGKSALGIEMLCAVACVLGLEPNDVLPSRAQTEAWMVELEKAFEVEQAEKRKAALAGLNAFKARVREENQIAAYREAQS